MPGDAKMDREDLIKTEIEYFDYSESERDKEIKDEDSSLIKRKDSNDDNDDKNQINSNVHNKRNN
jgi:hypothetical protein